MFIEQGIKAGNRFWKYILGSLLIMVASFFGQMPLLVGLLYETVASGKPYPTNNDAIMRFFEPNLMLFLILISFAFTLLGVYFVHSLFAQSNHAFANDIQDLRSIGIACFFRFRSGLFSPFYQP